MSKNKTLVKQNAVLIGTSVMLDECIEIAIKQFNKVFVITKDKKIKKKFKKKIKLIKLNQLKSVRSDYLFSILNDQILPFKYLKFIKKLSLNFHDGPLPKYAGLFSSSWAIINKEKIHGVCWHKIEKVIDAGDIFINKKFKISNYDTAYDIDTKSILIGIKLFKEIIQNLNLKKNNFKKQNLKKRTYFGKLEIKKLLKRFKYEKNNDILKRSLTLSPQKSKVLFDLFGIKINFFRRDFSKISKKIGKIDKKKIIRLIKLFNNVFKTNLKHNKLNLEEVALNNHPKWDSLAHVRLLSSVEQKFKISINDKNIENFSNLSVMYKYLDQKQKLN